MYNSSSVLAVDNTKTCPANFTRDLGTGMTGEDVRELQKYLNTTGFIVSNEGPGSVGNETTMFGVLTRTALANFQKANNIVATYGVFDIQTRTYLGCTETDTTSSITTKPSSFTFTRNLSLGMTGEDVRELQKYLNNNGFLVSETGVGSKGNESTYFGLKTKQALIRFQENNVDAILKPFNLTRGTGFFYASTRSFVNKTSSSLTTTIIPFTPPTSTTVISTIPLHDNPFASFFTLTYIPGFGGTITGVSPQNVTPGGSGTPVTAKPYVNYSFVNWSDGVTTPTRTDANVAGYKTVVANFQGNQSTGGSSWGGGGGGGGGSVPSVTYTLTYTAGSNGTISGTASQTVTSGGSGSAVTAVADTGYHFTTWSDGVTTAVRTDTGVAANLSVTASFAVNEQLITPTFTPNSGAIALGVRYGSIAWKHLVC
ncbi:MAG: S-layer domain protein [Parcubacteria group bacterium GW2011_GWF2_38_76]|nr:MAG: S-layer domain protein [Parcubacteria group bacterium GW2011_GWF2_38_76]